MSFPRWTADTTANTGMAVSYWIPAGLRKFAIYPADYLGGQMIQVTGVQEPGPLINATDKVPMPNDYVASFDNLASHVLLLKESPAIFAQGSVDYQKYLSVNKEATIWRGLTQPRYFIQAQQPKQ
jgi:hypothetical protein